MKSHTVCKEVDPIVAEMLCLYAKAKAYGAHHVAISDDTGNVELTFKKKRDAKSFLKALEKIGSRPRIGFHN